MKITESQLRNVIKKLVNEQVSTDDEGLMEQMALDKNLQPGTKCNTWEKLDLLTPGDRITINGKPATVIRCIDDELDYAWEGTSTRKYINTANAVYYAEDFGPGENPDDATLEYNIVYVGPGEPIKRPRLPRQTRSPTWPSLYD